MLPAASSSVPDAVPAAPAAPADGRVAVRHPGAASPEHDPSTIRCARCVAAGRVSQMGALLDALERACRVPGPDRAAGGMRHSFSLAGRVWVAAAGPSGTEIRAAEDTGTPHAAAHSGFVRLGREMKGRMEMTRVRRHRLVIGGVSLAGVGLAAGLWLAVPASATSSVHAGTASSSRSGRARTVSEVATPARAGEFPHWVPAGSGPAPTPPPGLGGPPHWAPAGSGPAPSGVASGS